MKNLTRLTLFCTLTLMFFSLNKTRGNSITSMSQNKITTSNHRSHHMIVPYNFNLPINYNSSPSLGFTFTDDVNQHSYMNKTLVLKSNNISNSGDNYIVCEMTGPIPSFWAGPVQCGFVKKSTKCPLKMEAVFSHSKVVASATSSSASVAIRTSYFLKYVTIALVLLMMPCGIPDNNVGGDGDDDDDDEDGNSDSDDDDDLEDFVLDENDVLVYTYEDNGNQRNNNERRFAFITNLFFPTTWKEVANSMHDDFILQYNVEPNNAIAGNPRLCCWGYIARYFEYNDPWSETDAGEPVQEFTPDQDWSHYVQPSINRINLYRTYYCNGF